jgi:hydrogenase maturation factor
VSVHGPDPPGTSARGRLRRAAGREDEGVPMRVLALDPAGGSLARCAGTDGIPRTVETALVGRLEPGAIVLVHSGVALVRLDAEWSL